MENHYDRYNSNKSVHKQTKQLFPYNINPNYITRKEMKVQIREAYEQWRKKYVREVKTIQTLYYIEYDFNGSTVSEAIGYGMLLMVGMAKLAEDTRNYFDGMLFYSKEHPSKGNPSLMAWKQVCTKNGSMEDELFEDTYSASDGDMDIAYSLLLADKLWGSDGKINYKLEANRIISALMDSLVNKREWTLKLGDWVHDEDIKYGTASRSSDWMVGHLYLFYQETRDERWMKVIVKIVDLTSFIQDTYSPKTGLLPDFVWKKNGEYEPVHPDFLEGKHDHHYYYNACRIPWRLAVGYHLYQDSRLKAQLDKINDWIKDFTKLDPDKIMSGYHLDGRPLSSYSDLAFISPFAVSASFDVSNQDWINKLWKRMTENYGANDDSNYYNDSLRLLSMISIYNFS